MQWRPSETLAGMITVRTFSELSAAEMWGILHLRSSIFVVEQDCVYLDPDTADFAEGTIHAFIGDDPLPAQLRAPPATRLAGRAPPDRRVAPHRQSRHCRELAGVRILGPDHPTSHRDSRQRGRRDLLNGQAHLEFWYGRFGYERCGDNFIEDDIPHVPMVKYTSGPDS